MRNVLVTGATGNVGQEVIKSLIAIDSDINVIAAVRDISRAEKSLGIYGDMEYRIFDFDDKKSFDDSLVDVDTVFLLRPPHIADIDKYFPPLFTKMKEKRIKKIVFLSVQGAEKSKVIPHNKIEKMINEFGFLAVMLRPSYFMQNLTTTLLNDIRKNEIILPSGSAVFNWIDIVDIGEVGAKVIDQFDKFKGEAIELTGFENLSFGKVVDYINEYLNMNLKYKSVNPFRYYKLKKGEGLAKGQVIVMLLLHFLPRFQKAPKVSTNIERITGHAPISMKEFIFRNNELFTSHQ